MIYIIILGQQTYTYTYIKLYFAAVLNTSVQRNKQGKKLVW